MPPPDNTLPGTLPEHPVPEPMVGGCESTQHGCCPNGMPRASAEDPCTEVKPIGEEVVGGCGGTEHGCCPGTSVAKETHDDPCTGVAKDCSDDPCGCHGCCPGSRKPKMSCDDPCTEDGPNPALEDPVNAPGYCDAGWHPGLLAEDVIFPTPGSELHEEFVEGMATHECHKQMGMVPHEGAHGTFLLGKRTNRTGLLRGLQKKARKAKKALLAKKAKAAKREDPEDMDGDYYYNPHDFEDPCPCIAKEITQVCYASAFRGAEECDPVNPVACRNNFCDCVHTAVAHDCECKAAQDFMKYDLDLETADYDCTTREAWSDDKKGFCCEMEGIGCGEGGGMNLLAKKKKNKESPPMEPEMEMAIPDDGMEEEDIMEQCGGDEMMDMEFVCVVDKCFDDW